MCFFAGLALNYLLQNNFKENVGMRPKARKIGVLVTDGKSQDDIIANSQSLRDQDIELYAIGTFKTLFPSLVFLTVIMSIPCMSTCSLWLTHTGVKNADENELRSIASDPEEIHMYNVADFSFLLDIVDDLTNNLCNSVKGPGTGPPCGHCTYITFSVYSFTNSASEMRSRRLKIIIA